MSEYTPSMDVVRRAASDYHAPITPEEFDRALAAHDAEVRASVLAEQGDGRRWFSAAYRAQNGNVIPIGDETVVRADAQHVVEEFAREDDEGPKYFLASRLLPPWLPVEEGETP